MPERCPHCGATGEHAFIEHQGTPALVLLDQDALKAGKREPRGYVEVRLFRCESCGHIMMFEP